MQLDTSGSSESPALPTSHPKLDLNDLLCQFDPDYNLPGNASPEPVCFDLFDELVPASTLPAESRLRRILHHADVEQPHQSSSSPVGMISNSTPPCPSLELDCLEAMDFPLSPTFSSQRHTTVTPTLSSQGASTTTTPSSDLNTLSPSAPSSAKTYVVPAPAIHVSELRRLQQQNRQALQISSPQKTKGGSKRAPKPPPPSPPNPTPFLPTPMAGLPIILVDPTTGQPIAAVAPQQPGMIPTMPGQSPIIGFLPQPSGPPAHVAFVPVPMPSAVSTMGTPSPNYMAQSLPTHLPHELMHMPGPPLGPLVGPIASGTPYGVPDMGYLATSPPYPIKPREKMILKIIDPESGQELTPEMINAHRHPPPPPPPRSEEGQPLGLGTEA